MLLVTVPASALMSRSFRPLAVAAASAWAAARSSESQAVSELTSASDPG
ncbi:MAG: hypothetical protein K2H18_04425 [Muribaculaceae bacterium]|nr:hypothetical protein [Muribaculaceae bacterium]